MQSPAAMSDPPAQPAGRAMSGAELRCLTESLGLSVAFLSRRWGMAEGRIKNLMKGTHPIPHKVAADVEAMMDDTEERLDNLLQQLQPGDPLGTYRSDSEYREHLGEDAPYNASWHRMLCARAEAEVDGVHLVYAVKAAYVVKRVGNVERIHHG